MNPNLPLLWTDRLLVGEPGAAPPRDFACVYMPVDEISRRPAELPPPGATLQVYGPGKLRAAAIETLNSLHRRAVAAEDTPPASTPGARYRLWRASRNVEHLLATQSMPARVIDLGCGGGRDAVLLAAAGAQVSAVDRLPDAIERARALAERYHVEHRIEWLVADTRSFPADALAQADVVLLNRHYHPGAFLLAASLLAPGGSLEAQLLATPRTASAANRAHYVDAVSARTALLEASLNPIRIEACRDLGRETIWIQAVRPAAL